MVCKNGCSGTEQSNLEEPKIGWIVYVLKNPENKNTVANTSKLVRQSTREMYREKQLNDLLVLRRLENNDLGHLQRKSRFPRLRNWSHPGGDQKLGPTNRIH